MKKIIVKFLKANISHSKKYLAKLDTKQINANDELERAKQIAKILSENFDNLFWLSEMYKRVALNNDIKEAYGTSYETHGLSVCINSLHDSVVISIEKIIAGTGKNTASLEEFIKIISLPEVENLFENERISSANKRGVAFIGNYKPTYDMRQREEKKHRERTTKVFLDSLFQSHSKITMLYKKLRGNHQYNRVRNFRNIHVAHKAIENKKDLPQWKDVLAIVDDLTPIIENVMIYANNTDVAHDEDYKKHVEQCANDFWKYACHLNSAKRHQTD